MKMTEKDKKHIEEQGISIKEVILRIGELIKYLFSKWKPIVVGSLVIAGLNITLELVTAKKYLATTTFVVQSDSKSGSVSSLASIVGINLGDLGSENELFSIDNIPELYRSYRMLKKTFLTEKTIDGENKRLITRYIEKKKLLRRWQKEEELADFSFEIPVEQMTQVHDSLMMVVLEDFKEKQLSAEKLSRKLSILKVSIVDKDEKFAKIFNEELVKNVNRFFLETKTKKTLEDLNILEKQADSVKETLDSALALYELSNKRTPNPNPLKSSAFTNSRKFQIDLEIAAAVYEEVLKQLAVARIQHQKNTPLIQILDRPIYPLENDKSKFLILLIKSGLLGGFLMLAFFVGKRMYESIMNG